MRGDVIISRTRTVHGTMAYRIRLHEGPEQQTSATHEAARLLAERFARTFHRDVWETDDNRLFTNLGGFRFEHDDLP